MCFNYKQSETKQNKNPIFSYNILELYNLIARSDLTQVKRNLISSIEIFVYKLSYELPKD